jgi:RHS repeat-associated protein
MRATAWLFGVLLSMLGSVAGAETLSYTTYYHNDHLGSPVAATNAQGALLWRAHFRPYGERQEDPQSANYGGVGYTGHVQDADSGMVYAGARYYDPLIGRFMAIDPAPVSPSHAMTFNRYAYAANSPMRFWDPDGREIVSANSRNNSRIESYINSRALGTFKFDGGGRLALVNANGDSSKRSAYYQSRLVEAINSQSIIKIDIASTFKDPKTGKFIDVNKAWGGGVTSYSPSNPSGNQTVTISGDSNNNLIDQFGNPLRDDAADILAHELVGHAIPHVVGSDSGNAVVNENKVRAEVPGSGVRAPEIKHGEITER